MRRTHNLKDRRNELPELYTVADYEKERRKNLKKGFWACVCGSRKFHLLQQKENVKAICSKCRNSDIIYWNGIKDSSKGSMRRLDTGKWVKGGTS